MTDVTHSKKDWDDFWYNSEEELPKQSKHNYNELVDHLVTTMRPPFVPKKVTQSKSNYEAPFDTPAYANYRDSVTPKERKSFDELYEEYSSKSIDEQVKNLKELGRELVSRIDRIVANIDVILEDDKVTK